MVWSRTFRRCRLALAVLLGALILLASGRAAAERSVKDLAERLRNASDFRVRVQAALALGASKSNDAVPPLCDGLEDANATVRSASAAGLGRLKKTDGISCLEKRAKSESNASVKTQIQRSITQIKSGGSAGAGSLARAPDGSTKWYVAIGETANKGDRSNGEIDAIVQKALRRALLANSAMAVAPEGETIAQGRGVIAKHRVPGYYLQATVEEPKYEDSKLTVRIRLTMYTYPNKALQGEFAPKLTQSGTPTRDTASEDELIKMATERAVARFITVAETTKN